MNVEQTMERLCPLRQFSQGRLLQRLRERIEQTPDVARFECLVLGLAPFAEDIGNVGVGAHTRIDATDHEIVGSLVGDAVILVGRNATILLVPFVAEHADGPGDELWQVSVDEPGVLASEFYLTAEAEIVAHEHGCTGDDPGREGLIMRVPEAEHPGVVLILLSALDFHQAEVA